MKKWWFGLFLLMVILIACIYIFIPSTYHIQRTATFNVPLRAVKRLVIDNSGNWNKWWPGDYDTSSNRTSLGSYRYNNSTYTVSDIKYNSITLTIKANGFDASGSFILIPGNTDSSFSQWEAVFSSSPNPFKRVQAYFTAKKLGNQMDAILKAAQYFFASQEKIYGIEIRKASVTDSILISTYSTSIGYPGTSFIYTLVDQLKYYAASKSATISGLPMLNIDPLDSGRYLIRVAIPVDKKLPSAGNISYKWMLGGGNILMAEVKGGPWQIDKAFHQVENYASDYGRVSPAIPFLSLVTDRRTEPDSLKWITRIYYPVM